MVRVRGSGPTSLAINDIDFPINAIGDWTLVAPEFSVDDVSVRRWYRSPMGDIMTESATVHPEVTTESLRNAIEEFGENFSEERHNCLTTGEWPHGWDPNRDIGVHMTELGYHTYGHSPLAAVPRNHFETVEEISQRMQDYVDGKNNPEKRATQLLKEHITEEQWDRLASNGYLEIPSSINKKRTYRIPRYYRNTWDMVQVWEDGECKILLCVQPETQIPDADRVLMHKLLIETDEAEYFNVAKKWCPRTHEELDVAGQNGFYLSPARRPPLGAALLRRWRWAVSISPPLRVDSSEIDPTITEMDQLELKFTAHYLHEPEYNRVTIIHNARCPQQFPDGFSATSTYHYGVALPELWRADNWQFFNDTMRRFQNNVVSEVRRRLER